MDRQGINLACFREKKETLYLVPFLLQPWLPETPQRRDQIDPSMGQKMTFLHPGLWK